MPSCLRRALFLATLAGPALASSTSAPADTLHSLCLEMKDGSVLIYQSWTCLDPLPTWPVAPHPRVEGLAWCFTPQRGNLGLRQRSVPLDSVRFAITDSELTLPGVKTLHKGSLSLRATSDELARAAWTGYWLVLGGTTLALLLWLLQVAP